MATADTASAQRIVLRILNRTGYPVHTTMELMRLFWALIPLVCAVCLAAQTEEPEVARARAEIEKLRHLVDAGVIPRNQLEKAEAAMADAQDAAFLRKTIYGQDLTV